MHWQHLLVLIEENLDQKVYWLKATGIFFCKKNINVAFLHQWIMEMYFQKVLLNY